MALTSMASVPLLSGDTTTGCIGFIKFGIKDWTPEELNALKAIASLFAQVQARVVAEDQLRYLAEHDDLTGLHNRRALLAHLDERLRVGQEGPVSVLFLDLDRLKAINDYLGHHAGDWFIQAFADRLREETGDGDVIARLGGDEFVIVPAGSVDAEAAEALAHRLQDALRDRVTIGGETLTRTVSAGVALGVPGRDTTSDLLRRADQAVLNAKNAGGNKIAVFTDEMSLRSEFRNDIELHLQNVIDTGSLILHYLPKSTCAPEILGNRGAGSLAAPDPRSAAAGLVHPRRRIHQFGRRIGPLGDAHRMRGVQSLAGQRHRRGCGHPDQRLPPVQLVADGFVQSVADTIAEFGLDGKSVCLEITESVVVQDIETTRITLAGLKDVGVRIAIDDFGTGYSVLTHLKSLPVDTLKIDKGFVLDLGTNPEDLAIVRAIIALAEAFNLELVAEGVESPTAAMTLLQHGCHRAQGFLLSRPIPPSDAMAELFAKRVIPVDFFSVPSRN